MPRSLTQESISWPKGCTQSWNMFRKKWVTGACGPWVTGTMGHWDVRTIGQVTAACGPLIIGACRSWLTRACGLWVTEVCSSQVTGVWGPWITGVCGPWVTEAWDHASVTGLPNDSSRYAGHDQQTEACSVIASMKTAETDYLFNTES